MNGCTKTTYHCISTNVLVKGIGFDHASSRTWGCTAYSFDNFNKLNTGVSFVVVGKDGIGTEAKYAYVITPDEEEALWTNGIIGTNSIILTESILFNIFLSVHPLLNKYRHIH